MENVKDSLYEVIGVPLGATVEHIKAACLRLGETYHPERDPGDADRARKFKAVEDAYAVLSDPVKRAAYDRERLEGLRQTVEQVPPPAEVDSSDAKSADGSTKTTESNKKSAARNYLVVYAIVLVLFACPFIFVGSALVSNNHRPEMFWKIGIAMNAVGIGLVVIGAIVGFWLPRLTPKSIEGPCPYCGSTVVGIRLSKDQGITCGVCNKRIAHRGERFYKID